MIKLKHKHTKQVVEMQDSDAAQTFLNDIGDPENWDRVEDEQPEA